MGYEFMAQVDASDQAYSEAVNGARITVSERAVES